MSLARRRELLLQMLPSSVAAHDQYIGSTIGVLAACVAVRDYDSMISIDTNRVLGSNTIELTLQRGYSWFNILLVNLPASIAGLRYIGKPQVAYSATKAAVIQFTKATAVIYAKRNIRMNVVVPGLIHTPLVGYLADKYNGGDLPGFVEKCNKAVPIGRMGDSFDVANVAGFLLSDSVRYITGQKIVVDGGITSSTG